MHGFFYCLDLRVDENIKTTPLSRPFLYHRHHSSFSGRCSLSSPIGRFPLQTYTQIYIKKRIMNSFFGSSGSDSSDSDTENEFEVCCTSSGSCSRYPSGSLPFDPTSIENIILSISDRFNFRVLLNDSRAKKAVLITAGLTLAGSLIGKHYGGKAGAAVGGAIGGACGLGVVVVSMRDIWQDIKGKLWELFDIVYDYLAGLGIEDYKMAAKFLMQNSGQSSQLAMLILQVTSDVLGKQILSSLTASV